MSGTSRETGLDSVERDVAATIGRALLARALTAEGTLQPGLPADLADAALLGRKILNEIEWITRLAAFGRSRFGVRRLRDLSPSHLEAFTRVLTDERQRSHAEAKLREALSALERLEGKAPTFEKAPTAPKPRVALLYLPVLLAVHEFARDLEREDPVRQAALGFGESVHRRMRGLATARVGREHFQVVIEEMSKQGSAHPALRSFVEALTPFAQAIARVNALDSAWKAFVAREEDQLGKEFEALLEKSPELVPDRFRIERCVRHLERERGIRSLQSISPLHQEYHLGELITGGATLDELIAAGRALEAFSKAVGRPEASHLAAMRLAKVVELRHQGGCWVARVGPGGERRLTEAGFALHPHERPETGCRACSAQVPPGAGWTDEVLRAEHFRKEVMTAETRALLLREAQAFRTRSLGLSMATSADIDIPAPPGRSYFPFQKAAMAYALMRRRTLLADEMGLGKTVETLGVVNALPSLRRIVVVAPATLLYNWKCEAEAWLVTKTSIHVLDGPVPVPEGDGLFIVSYSRLAGAIGDALRAREWDLLVADEAHYIKNPKAQRSLAVYGEESENRPPGLLARAERALFLTGTPVLNRQEELITLVRHLQPHLWGELSSFERVLRDDGQEALARQLRETVLVRRDKAQVLPELPKKRRVMLTLPPECAQHQIVREREVVVFHVRAIRALEEEMGRTSAEGNRAAYERSIARLREAQCMAWSELSRMRHQTALAKAPFVIQRVEDILEEGVGKIVAWAHHRDVIAMFLEKFKDRAVCVWGGMSSLDRHTAVHRFQTDPACKVFLGSIRAAREGITLVASAHVIFAELDWTPGYLSQAEDRCHRIGQTESVLSQLVVVDGSLDARMAKVLVAKERLVEALLEGREVRPEEEEVNEGMLHLALGSEEQAA